MKTRLALGGSPGLFKTLGVTGPGGGVILHPWHAP